MTYSASYESTDLGSIFIDLIGTVVVVITQNAALLVTLLILGIVAIRGKQILNAVFGLVR